MNKTQRIEAVMEVVRIIVALAIAYGIALVILFLVSDEPLFIIKQFILGPFSSQRRIGSIINLAVPFTLCGLSMCFISAVNKFNLIGESIFMLAAAMVTWAGLSLAGANLPAAVMVTLMYVVAIVTGVVLAFIPAILDRKFNANVVVTSLMLNSAVAYLAVYILRYKLRDPNISYMGSMEIPESIQIPNILGKFRIQSGVFVAIAAVIIVAIIFYKTSFGWKMRLVGANPKFSQAVGLSSVGISFTAQLAGGALAGIGGATEMMSNYTRFQWTATTGHGFDGLLVAVLARNNPVLVPVAALFLAYIRIGADVVNTSGDIPIEFVTVIQGIIILLVAAESFMSGMKNRLIFKAAEEDEKAKSAVKSDSDSASAEVKAVSTDTDTAKKIAAVGDDGGGTSSDETKKEDPSL